ncbi:sugar phosphate isomerase/epimerase [Neobacillus bataviensis]|uniref:Sugar phosphate isomerase/epimerase n=1 Tax=Neobacillus bataviensis TaxID=220685 RepID=A0A561DYQ8_9BACI|nr:sugar phosphate isomerase/epimerase [Neobacillus bataviensis]TWE08491.1 sugar phosphate isomerase/epimerase [Neobacillus bataviensis]
MTMEIGLNLFSVFRELNEDYFGTLEKVAGMGYKNIELITANFSNGKRYSDTFTISAIKQKFNEFGLNAFAAHEGVAPGQSIMDNDWDKIIAENEELECKSIVFPMAFISGLEDTLQTAQQLNKIGEKCKEAGINFYYHNHAHEFKRVGDQSLFDLLVENTNPEFVKFELDLVWAMRGGYEPISLLEKLGSRCDLIHQKDLGKHVKPVNLFTVMKGEEDPNPMKIYTEYVKPTDFVNLGTGIVNFEENYKKLNELGYIRYAIVENEGQIGDKFTSIKSDLNVMKETIQGLVK